MGIKVYDFNDSDYKNIHIHCHSRKDGKSGFVYLIINNSLTDSVTMEIPSKAERYTLSAKTLRSSIIQLNGKNLSLLGTTQISDLTADHQNAGTVEFSPASCTFLVL